MRFALLSALLATGTGCGGTTDPPFPELAPVAGVVKRGDRPVAGGTLTLATDPPTAEFLVNAEVGADGRFTLTTVRATDKSGERKPGVPAGTYAVTYLPPGGDQLSGGVPSPVTLPPLTVPREGNPNLALALPGKK